MSNGYINIPESSWRLPVPSAFFLPATGNNLGDAIITEDTDTIYVWNGSAWVAVASPSGASAIDGLTGDVSATGPGVVSATVNSVGGSSASAVNTATVLVNSSHAANTILATPNGSSGSASFRALVANDIPSTLNNTTIPTATVSSSLVVEGNYELASNNTTSVNSGSSPYSVVSTDYALFVDTTSGAVTINLPNPNQYRTLYIKDVGGNFGTNNLTLARFGSEKIEGVAASLVLSANYGSYTFQSDGINWWKVSTAANFAYIVFQSSGSWTAPGGVTSVTAYGRPGAGGGAGGSGGGGGAAGTSAGAGAGGGGGAPGGAAWLVDYGAVVTPGTTYTITIGAGGSGGAGGAGGAGSAGASNGTNGTAGSPGTNGGSTSFGSIITFSTWSAATSFVGGGGGTNVGGGNAGITLSNGGNGTNTSNALAGGLYNKYGNTPDNIPSPSGSGAGGSHTGGNGNPGTQPAQPNSADHIFGKANIGTAGSVGTGGTGSGGAWGGGGGGGPGLPQYLSDNGILSSGGLTTAASGNGGNGGNGSSTNGGNGTDGTNGANAVNGSGGPGGGGGGGGGAGGTTGGTGGNGGNGGNGSNGALILTWNE